MPGKSSCVSVTGVAGKLTAHVEQGQIPQKLGTSGQRKVPEQLERVARAALREQDLPWDTFSITSVMRVRPEASDFDRGFACGVIAVGSISRVAGTSDTARIPIARRRWIAGRPRNGNRDVVTAPKFAKPMQLPSVSVEPAFVKKPARPYKPGRESLVNTTLTITAKIVRSLRWRKRIRRWATASRPAWQKAASRVCRR